MKVEQCNAIELDHQIHDSTRVIVSPTLHLALNGYFWEFFRMGIKGKIVYKKKEYKF